MRLVIVSGLSGAGKSVALHTLEDLGYYCVDNLPATLLPAFSDLLVAPEKNVYENAAVGIDARNPVETLQCFPDILSKLRAQKVACEVFFLEADNAILIKRFSETRRRHPLTSRKMSLAEAIQREREIMEVLAIHADFRIDTSRTNLHQLRDIVRQRMDRHRVDAMSLLVQSFGFKHGIPADADFVFDLRCLPNPHWDPNLRPYTGLDENVAGFLGADAEVNEMFENLKVFLETWIPRFQKENRSYLTVALGCTGGQHRSVYMVERLARYFSESLGDAVIVRHRELP